MGEFEKIFSSTMNCHLDVDTGCNRNVVFKCVNSINI